MNNTSFALILNELKERRHVLHEEHLTSEQKRFLYIELEKWHEELGTTQRSRVVLP